MPDKYRNPEWIEHFSRDYKSAARKIEAAGMLLMYHNHNFEFEKVNGKYYLEYLMEGFEQDELGFTLDTYWLQAAGTDVCQWIERLKDRIPCVHLKDMAMVRHEAVMAPELEGNMNFKGILKTLEDTVCEYILVEQDICQESPFICLEKSYRNLSALGYR
jgi:sugar phosphate isomerase/epimerase